MPKSPTPKIFISYAREDARDIAIQIHKDLTSAGHDAWLDLSKIEAGASWSRDIEVAIESAEIVLTLLSVGSYVSEICRAEQLRALRKNKRVVPILLQSDADRPLHLENLNYLDFTQPAHYKQSLQSLLNTIATGQIPRRGESPRTRTATIPAVKPSTNHIAQDEKRDSRAFRRYLTDLREEAWLGSRYWWPFFLFYFADVHEIAFTLEQGTLMTPAQQLIKRGIRKRVGSQKANRWDHTVRLYFRPRTPDLFVSEGTRPASARGTLHHPIPIYLLFDMEGLITQGDSRFSEGDVTKLRKSYKAASAFRDMPFDLIYHNSWFRPDERDEVMTARRAQVIMEGNLNLTHLQHIWCRSSAEYETLRTLLPDHVWRQWRDKITTRTDYNLFNRKWIYVDEAILMADVARFRFNPCDSYRDDCRDFTTRVEIEYTNGDTQVVDIPEFEYKQELLVDIGEPQLAYTIKLYCDDALIYAGRFVDDNDVF